MRQAAIPRPGRVPGWLREYLPDRNPLRRASDRTQATIIGVLVIVFLAAAPLAAITANSWTDGPREVAPQTRYHVAAVLLAGAPRPIGYRYPGTADLFAPARWATPAGTLRTGQIPVTAVAEETRSRLGATEVLFFAQQLPMWEVEGWRYEN